MSPHLTEQIHPMQAEPIFWTDRFTVAVIVGDLYYAAERGQVKDVFSAYGRLLFTCGRTMSDAPARMQGPYRPLLPLSVIGPATERVAVLHEAIGSVIRNLRALDAEAHWRGADGAMKGLALAEYAKFGPLIAEGQIEAQRAESEEDAEAILRCVDLRREDQAYFCRLSNGVGWGDR
jgi:hypothetical protein